MVPARYFISLPKLLTYQIALSTSCCQKPVDIILVPGTLSAIDPPFICHCPSLFKILKYLPYLQMLMVTSTWPIPGDHSNFQVPSAVPYHFTIHRPLQLCIPSSLPHALSHWVHLLPRSCSIWSQRQTITPCSRLPRCHGLKTLNMIHIAVSYQHLLGISVVFFFFFLATKCITFFIFSFFHVTSWYIFPDFQLINHLTLTHYNVYTY